MQDSHTGVTLVCWQRRDSVYYWPKSVPLQSLALALSSSARPSLVTISMWHSRLDHSSLLIFRKFLSVLIISFPEEHLFSFSCSSCSIHKSHKLPFAKSSITSSCPFDVIFSNVHPHPFPILMVFITTLFLLTISQSVFGFIYYVVNHMLIQPLLPSSNLLKIISPPPLKHFTPITRVNS